VQVGEVMLPEDTPVRPYELTCGIWHVGGALRIGVRANVRNPGEAFAHRMLDRFVTVLNEAAEARK